MKSAVTNCRQADDFVPLFFSRSSNFNFQYDSLQTARHIDVGALCDQHSRETQRNHDALRDLRSILNDTGQHSVDASASARTPRSVQRSACFTAMIGIRHVPHFRRISTTTKNNRVKRDEKANSGGSTRKWENENELTDLIDVYFGVASYAIDIDIPPRVNLLQPLNTLLQ